MILRILLRKDDKFRYNISNNHKEEHMNYQELLNDQNPEITISVESFGDIKLQLFPKVAPNTVRNFIHLAEKGFFDQLIFHRIIEGFMIQGGQSKELTCAIRGEFASNGISNPLKHHRGVISMARTNDKNSASSQFFIMHQAAPHLDGNYAAFGATISGFEHIDQIASVKTNMSDRPYDDVRISKITVDKKGIIYEPPVCFSQKV